MKKGSDTTPGKSEQQSLPTSQSVVNEANKPAVVAVFKELRYSAAPPENVLFGISLAGNPKTSSNSDKPDTPNYLRAMMEGGLSNFRYVGVLFGDRINYRNVVNLGKLKKYDLHQHLFNQCGNLLQLDLNQINATVLEHLYNNVSYELQNEFKEAGLDLDKPRENLDLFLALLAKYIKQTQLLDEKTKLENLFKLAEEVKILSQPNLASFRENLWKKISPFILLQIDKELCEKYQQSNTNGLDSFNYFVAILGEYNDHCEKEFMALARVKMAEFWQANKNAFLWTLTPEQQEQLNKFNEFEEQIKYFNSVSSRIYLFLWDEFIKKRPKANIKRNRAYSPAFRTALRNEAISHVKRQVNRAQFITVDLPNLAEGLTATPEINIFELFFRILKDESVVLENINENAATTKTKDTHTLVIESLEKQAENYQNEEWNTIPLYMLSNSNNSAPELRSYKYFGYPGPIPGANHAFEYFTTGCHAIEVDFVKATAAPEKILTISFPALVAFTQPLVFKKINVSNIDKNQLATLIPQYQEETILITAITEFVHTVFNYEPYATYIQQKVETILAFLAQLKKIISDTDTIKLNLTKGVFAGIATCSNHLMLKGPLQQIIRAIFTASPNENIINNKTVTADKAQMEKIEREIGVLITSLYKDKRDAMELGNKLFGKFAFGASKPEKNPDLPSVTALISLLSQQSSKTIFIPIHPLNEESSVQTTDPEEKTNNAIQQK